MTLVVPTMFQCMVYSTDVVFDLRRMCLNAKKNPDVVLEVKARSPGSLGQDVVNIDEWTIGSLAFRVYLEGRTSSVFVFASGKIKISGGSAGHQFPYESWLENAVVNPVMTLMRGLNSSKTPTSWGVFLLGTLLRNREAHHEEPRLYDRWELCLLNGSMAMDTSLISRSTYKAVCQFIVAGVKTHPFFVSATMPACYDVNGGVKRGRVCSIALKFSPRTTPGKMATHAPKRSHSTVRFDHGGRVQFFALRSFDEMRVAAEHLRSFVGAFGSSCSRIPNNKVDGGAAY